MRVPLLLLRIFRSPCRLPGCLAEPIAMDLRLMVARAWIHIMSALDIQIVMSMIDIFILAVDTGNPPVTRMIVAIATKRSTGVLDPPRNIDRMDRMIRMSTPMGKNDMNHHLDRLKDIICIRITIVTTQTAFRAQVSKLHLMSVTATHLN